MYWSPGGKVFLGLCLVLAIVGGFFSTVYAVSAYSVVTAEFPVHTGLIIVGGLLPKLVYFYRIYTHTFA